MQYSSFSKLKYKENIKVKKYSEAKQEFDRQYSSVTEYNGFIPEHLTHGKTVLLSPLIHPGRNFFYNLS